MENLKGSKAAETIRDYRLLITPHSLSLFFSPLKVLAEACSGSPLPNLAPLFASQLAGVYRRCGGGC
ncbi:hypothetical protein NL676_030560 [Syzygium grande]|nr:hypothetical protein NL676_030560 [Syzygium grande]